MPTTHDSLLAAVCRYPTPTDRGGVEEDTPRLVYAEYLEEFAHYFPDPAAMRARSEFIKVQCEVARTEGYPGERFCASANGLLRVGVPDCSGCRPCGLRNSEATLFSAFGAAWFGRNACLTPPNDREQRASGAFLVIRRGWGSEWFGPAESWLQHHRSLVWCRQPCPTCKGHGRDKEVQWKNPCPTCHGDGTVPPTDACPLCVVPPLPPRLCSKCGTRGSGRVVRPFVATCQPITDVWLTDRPIARSVEEGGAIGSPGIDPALWPGITFHRPATPTQGDLVIADALAWGIAARAE